MSRATIVYIVMVVALAGGLWAVLELGNGLVAPEDLGGRWVAAGPTNVWSGLTVEQSGRYFDLEFDNGDQVNATMVGQPSSGPVQLARGPWQVTIDAPAADGTRAFHVTGPKPGTFVGRLESRKTAKPTTAPAAAK